MAKVDPARRGAMAPLNVRSRAVRPAAPAPQSQPEQAPAKIPPHIAALVAEIDECGVSLRDDPTGTALERYKQALRRFFDAAVADATRISSEMTLGLSRKVFSTIARVDLALADLADAVLGRQQDMLKLGALVDQIKGLVIDLYR